MTSTRAFFFFAGLALFACACAKAQTTPAGRLGNVDLKGKLPEGITKGPDDVPGEHERSAEVCHGNQSPGVQVKVRWETFAKKDNVYISSYDVELTKPRDGISVRLAEPGPVTNANHEPNAPHISLATITIMCTIDGVDQKGVIQIRGDGKVGGAEPAPKPSSSWQ
jgi:hypothetical protein